MKAHTPIKHDDSPQVVSCLSLSFYYDYLKTNGINRRELQQGLPYSPEYLDNRSNWIDIETMRLVEKHIEKLFPDEPDIHFKIGQSIEKSSGFGFIGVMFRAFVSPMAVYYQIPKFIRKFAFRFVTVALEKTSRSSLRLIYQFDDGFPPTSAFLDTVRGLLTAFPVMMGAPAARVRMQRLSDLVAQFDVVLSAEWRGIFPFIASFFRRLTGTFGMRWRNLLDATSELETTNFLLQEKVDVLTSTEKELNLRIRNLSILNTLGHAFASERKIAPLIARAAEVISNELSDSPTAILLNEGNNLSLVPAGWSKLDNDTHQAVNDLCVRGNEQIKQLAKGQPIELSTSSGDMIILPMISRDSLVGALALLFPKDSFETTFLESISSQLAVAIDNALSNKIIRELRDNLELRVKERTAELEMARDKLEATIQQLRQADRARAELFTNVSHEFRTPLTLILAPLQEMTLALRRAGLVDELEQIELVKRNANNLLQLISEILDFAELDGDNLKLSLLPLRPVEMLQDLLINLEPMSQRRNQKIVYQVQDEQIELVADPKLFRRILINLLGNAVKHSSSGDSITITMSHDSDWFYLDVIDTGPGIAPDQQKRIFERFQRVIDNKGRTVEGSGIGLAIVKDIVEKHFGHVELRSVVDEGSHFRVSLPLTLNPNTESPTTDSDHYSAELLKQLTASSSFLPKPRQHEETVSSDSDKFVSPFSRANESTILVVEDNQDMRSFLTKLLGRTYQVITAENGLDGIKATRERLPDVVVLDVMMPHMNGFEMCRRIKEDPLTSGIPVLLLTARHGTEAAIEGFEAGAADFVVKPFIPKELLARVDAQARIRSLTTSLIRAEKQISIGIMSAGIAHEVLNPVGAIINAVKPLRTILSEVGDNSSDDSAKLASGELLDAIETSGKAINDIVRAILSFARQEQDTPALLSTNVVEGIDSVLSIINFRLIDRIQIHTDYKWRDTLLCHGDLLNQAIMNLIINALDALGPDGGNIWIRTEGTNYGIQISIKDDGPGIPPEVREKIFTPFYTTKDPGEGTGLGLAIVQEIVSLHDGRLNLSTETGKGSEFTILIPFKSEHAD